ncbi:phosphoribosylglycinamide formyltransferase [bacterium]|nr:phosphoribosylglycinamide formyltransferase [bacterium]
MAHGYWQVRDQPVNIVIFASGNGSNAEVLVRWAIANPARVKVAGLLTDNPQAGVIQRAGRLQIPVRIVEKPSKSIAIQNPRAWHESAILDAISGWRPDWIFLAGYMRILSVDFLRRFQDPVTHRYRVVNIHPSILPDFPGMDAYRRTFESGVSEGGVTVHLVDEGVDTGPVLAQERFPRLSDDDLASFVTRGQSVEHRLYTDVLARIVENGGVFP